MLGKILLKELLQYFKRLWPFMLAVVAMSVLAKYIILNDKNPYEMWGTLTGAVLFIFAAYVFVVGSFTHVYVSFYKKLRSENVQYFASLYSARLLAFIIYMVFSALLLLAGVAVFAPNNIIQTFSSFPAEWPYFIEFLLYCIIAVLTLYLIPTSWIIIFRFRKQFKLPVIRSVVTGIIAFYLGVGSLVTEISLLMGHNDPTVDLPLLWIIFGICTAAGILIDIRAFLLTKRTLKTVLYDTQNEDNY